MLLAELILKLGSVTGHERGRRRIARGASNPAAALALAGDLARLMDDMATRQVPWDRLDRWCRTTWTNIGSTRCGSCRSRATLARDPRRARPIEPAERRDRLIDAEGERLARSNGPVIAAGSTGSMPATAKLLATIARSAARRGGAARPRHRSRRRDLEADRDRPQRPRRRPRSSAVRHASAAAAASASAATRSRRWRRRRRTAASWSVRRRCGRRSRPTCGGAGSLRRTSPPKPTPRSDRSR